MTRREARKNAFRLIFQKYANDIDYDEIVSAVSESNEMFGEDILSAEELVETDEFCLSIVRATANNLAQIDDSIRPYLNRWSLERLPKVSLAILRISCAQLLYFDELPVSVIINEAVELAKEFGSDDEYSFVNGTLRSIAEAVRKGN